jgi:hypothetical protein
MIGEWGGERKMRSTTHRSSFNNFQEIIYECLVGRFRTTCSSYSRNSRYTQSWSKIATNDHRSK